MEKEGMRSRRGLVLKLPWLRELKEPQQRAVQYGVLVVALGLLLMLLQNTFTTGGLTQEQGALRPSGEVSTGREVGLPQGMVDPISLHEQALSNRVERVLGRMAGLGEVWVEVILEGTPREDYVFENTDERSTTEEQDSEGGERRVQDETARTTVAVIQQGGGEAAVTYQTERAGVKGVLVVAEGAADPELRVRAARAVATLLDLPLHRVTVLPAKGGN